MCDSFGNLPLQFFYPTRRLFQDIGYAIGFPAGDFPPDSSVCPKTPHKGVLVIHTRLPFPQFGEHAHPQFLFHRLMYVTRVTYFQHADVI